MTLDDHEVDDDWRWLDDARTLAYIPWWDRLQRLFSHRSLPERRIPRQRVQDALQAYWEHQGMHAPHFELPFNLTPAGQYDLAPSDPGSLSYTFTYGAAAFFVLDTRTMRIANRAQQTMLGEAQWQALQTWLLAVRESFPVKFIVSSCSLLFDMWLDIPRDRWSGFPQERNRLLHFLAANGIEGVYLLTGDLHSAHAIRAELYGPQARALPVWEFCSTPFEQHPNWLSSRTYRPPHSAPIRGQECFFKVNALNFGVVRVAYPQGEAPQVRFEVYGVDGRLLGEAGD
jgi:phosphodiesterase/alkaline phosphatase D-like protein